MNIIKTQNADTLNVAVEGRLNTTTAPELEAELKASLDGADQWTCVPGSASSVPAKDELYYRKEDKFQLNNVIDQHPEKALELYNKLTLFMEELAADA